MTAVAMHTADTVEVVLSEPENHEYRLGSLTVHVHGLTVKFDDQEFSSITLHGRATGSSTNEEVTLTVVDPKVLPRWAVPWTVFLAWEVA